MLAEPSNLRRYARASVLSAAWIGVAVGAVTAQVPELGYVSFVRGPWLISGEPAHVGTVVFPDDTFTLEHRAEEGSALSVMTPQGQRIRFLCERSTDCRDAVVPADSIRSGRRLAWVSEIVRAVGDLIEPPRRTLEVGAARGGGLRAAVLVANDGGLDVAPTLAEVVPGRYRLELSSDDGPVLPDGGPTAPPERYVVSLSWRGVGPLLVEGPGAEMKVWRARLLTNRGDDTPLSETLVLAAPPSSFGDAQAAFADARRLTADWSDATRDEVALFLVTYIRHLAGSHG